MTGTPVHYTPVMEVVLSPPQAPTEGDTEGPGVWFIVRSASPVGETLLVRTQCFLWASVTFKDLTCFFTWKRVF